MGRRRATFGPIDDPGSTMKPGHGSVATLPGSVRRQAPNEAIGWKLPRSAQEGSRPYHGVSRRVVPVCQPLTGTGGTSVVELLTSMLFVSILMAMSYTFARAALVSARVQETVSDTQEVVLMTMDLLTRELRMAGFSAAGKPIIGVRAANAAHVEVATDFDGDGDSDDPNELIAYGYNEAKRQIVRATGGASPQPLLRNVPPDGLRFTYFDATEAEIAVPADAMPLASRQRIHRIDVLLRAESSADSPGGKPVAYALSSSICLRNQ